MSDNVTLLLKDWRAGSEDGREALWTVIYRELRNLAGHYNRDQRPGHTLQPTALDARRRAYGRTT